MRTPRRPRTATLVGALRPFVRLTLATASRILGWMNATPEALSDAGADPGGHAQVRHAAGFTSGSPRSFSAPPRTPSAPARPKLRGVLRLDDVQRPELPLHAEAGTSVARRHRWVIRLVIAGLALTGLIALTTLLAGMVVSLAALGSVAMLARRVAQYRDAFSRLTVDNRGVFLWMPFGDRGTFGRDVTGVHIRAIHASGSDAAFDVDSLVPRAAPRSEPDNGHDTPPEGPDRMGDPLIASLVGIGMGTKHALPSLLITFNGPTSRIRLRGTHEWRVAHAIAAEACHHGIQPDIGHRSGSFQAERR